MKNTKQKNFLFTPLYLLANLVLFLVLTGNQFFILYPLRLNEIGKNEAQIGFLMGVLSLAAFLSRPFLGILIDRFGRRIFIFWGSLTMAIVILAYSLSWTSIIFLTFIRFLHGLTFAVFFTSIFTWAADYSPKDRLAEGIGIFGISGLLSYSSGTFLGELVLNYFKGNFIPFYFIASIITFLGTLISLYLKDSYIASSTPASGFWKLLFRLDLFSIIFVSIIFGVALGVITNFMAPYGRTISINSVTPFFTAYILAAIIIRIFSGKAADRLGKTTMIFPAVIIFSLGQIALIHPYFIKMLVLLGFFLGCGHGLVYPALNALIVERAGEKDRGTGTALFTGAVDMGIFIGSTFFGAIAKFSNYKTMYILSGTTTFLSLFIFFILEKILCRVCKDIKY